MTVREDCRTAEAIGGPRRIMVEATSSGAETRIAGKDRRTVFCEAGARNGAGLAEQAQPLA